jgi:hypothetical protein
LVLRIDARVNENLIGDVRAAAIASHLADYGSQVASGAIATYGDAGGVGCEVFGMIHDVFRDGVAVLGGGWIAMFGGKTVVDRHDQGAGRVG